MASYEKNLHKYDPMEFGGETKPTDSPYDNSGYFSKESDSDLSKTTTKNQSEWNGTTLDDEED